MLSNLRAMGLIGFCFIFKSGTEVRRTSDVKLRFVGIIRLVSFHFSHVQLLRFVTVMVRSYSFGHLDSVK